MKMKDSIVLADADQGVSEPCNGTCHYQWLRFDKCNIDIIWIFTNVNIAKYYILTTYSFISINLHARDVIYQAVLTATVSYLHQEGRRVH